MIKLVLCFETDKYIVGNELYKVLRKNQGYTFIPSITYLDDVGLCKRTEKILNEVLVSKLENEMDHYILLDSIFSTYVAFYYLEKENIRHEIYNSVEKVFLMDKPTDVYLDLITTLLKPLSSEECKKELLFNIMRPRVLSDGIRDQLVKFAKAIMEE